MANNIRREEVENQDHENSDDSESEHDVLNNDNGEESSESNEDESENAETTWDQMVPALFSFETTALAVVSEGNMEKLRELSKKKSFITSTDNRGWLPLHKAVSLNNYKAVKILLRGYSYGVHVRTYEGESPLLLACKVGADMKIIRLLLRLKSDVNLCDDSKCSPLHAACERNNLELIKLLVQGGANLNAQTVSFEAPLHIVLDKEMTNLDIVSYLLECGSDLNVKDIYGRTPLFIAATNANVAAVSAILEYPCEVNAIADDNVTPLMMAAQSGSLEIVRMLIDKGADPNIRSDDKMIAVHFAAHKDHASVMEYLLDKSDPLLVNRSTTCAVSLLELIIMSCSVNCLEFLLSSKTSVQILSTTSNILVSPRSSFRQYIVLSPIGYLFKEANSLSELDSIKNMLNIMIKRGFPVNSSRTTCMPPLVAAIVYLEGLESSEKIYFIQNLIDCGADVNYGLPEAPDSLLTACNFTEDPNLFLLLLQNSDFATPDSVFNHFFKEKDVRGGSFSFIFLLVQLGVSSFILKKLKDICYECHEHLYPIGLFQTPYSLQQLSRNATRHFFFLNRRNFCLDKIMEIYNLPATIRNYLKYRNVPLKLEKFMP